MKYSKNDIQEKIRKAVNDVRTQNPMAPSITNSVTINLVANAQLAVGGSAAMVYLPDEGEGMAEAAKSLYINAGTMIPVYGETLPRTARRLSKLSRPWVLDPVGIGLGGLRTELLTSMGTFRPGIIRGNASEIIALAGLWNAADVQESNVRGVDSMDSVEDARDAADALALFTGGAVAVSGADDYVTDGVNKVTAHGGSKFFPMITGAGCSLGGVMAIYACVEEPFIAALTAVNIYNIAGQRAEKACEGPGSFQVHFLDELYRSTPDDVAGSLFDMA